MLKTFLPLLIILLANYGLVSEAQAQKLEVSKEFMEGCEMGTTPCEPIIILRSHHDEDWNIVLPSGGTLSTVILYNQEGIDLFWSGKMEEAIPIRQDKCGPDRLPKLNLKGLPDGTYFLQMISCGLGGGFQLELGTDVSLSPTPSQN